MNKNTILLWDEGVPDRVEAGLESPLSLAPMGPEDRLNRVVAFLPSSSSGHIKEAVVKLSLSRERRAAAECR